MQTDLWRHCDVRSGAVGLQCQTLPGREMRLVAVQVECYAGSKADETPRRFRGDDRNVEIVEIVDRWYQVESKPEWPRADYFKVRGEDGREYLLKHDLESDEWFLGQQW